MNNEYKIDKKLYLLNKLPIIFFELLIIIIFNILFNNNDIFIGIILLSVIVIGVTIICYIKNYNLNKNNDLTINKNGLVKLTKYIGHGGTFYEGFKKYSTQETYIIDKISNFKENLFSFVIYGDVDIIKLDEFGKEKKYKSNKLIIKKIYNNSEEIRKSLDLITKK